MQDDESPSRLAWERYEAQKREIAEAAVDADEYEARVRELAKDMML